MNVRAGASLLLFRASPRTALFIDGHYLSQITRSMAIGRLDHHRFAVEVTGGVAPSLVHLYETYPWPREGETPATYWARVDAKRRYLHAVAQVRGLRVRVPDPVPGTAGDPLPQASPPFPDVLLTVDLVRLAERNRIDKAVLIWIAPAVTPAITHVREEGIQVTLAHGVESLTPPVRLIRAVDQAGELSRKMLVRCTSVT